MTDSTKNPTTLERVLAALAELGPATAARISEVVGIAYPTTTAKLRELESAGYAERLRTEQRTTLWQVTETGKAAVASVTAGSTSMQAPSPSDDQAGESQQRADLHPEAEPEPGSGAPIEDPAPGSPPTDQQGGDSAETGPASPTPPQAPGPDVAGGSEPMPELETNSTTEAVHQTPALPEGAGTGPQERDGRRKSSQPRRRKGELREEVLALLQGNPGTAYKVGEICKLINQSRDGEQINKASAGAVANALDKLAMAGSVMRVDTKVATYQAD